MQAIYIDEANTQTVSASLLSGAGYVRPDGTHGYGHNTLGMRDQLKRIRQLFIDHGRRPVVWIPVYGMIIPHAFAFVDVVSEGESFMFDDPNKEDWVDLWAGGLLDPEKNPKAHGGPWLLSLGPAQKFGFTPLFLDYIKYRRHPKFLAAVRGRYGLLGLLDIIPIDPYLGWFFKVKQDFGVAKPDVTFHRFFEQKEIRTQRADVAVSYYKRPGSVLAVVTNLGKQLYEGPITLDLAALGLAQGKVEAAEVDGASTVEYQTETTSRPLELEAGGALRMTIPSHDFRLVWVRQQ
jgi:hypothetical protein